ncbi:glycosyltransferase family 4 protein [Dysgonomonas sp. 216]|uniref:glycosyltransferase family 4 protein n=1 Tax=Dysgonomonas sp. 216 TaxID=2302934 RepID=UPI00210807D8|nr:glycosyltransferase family 4 protein [Dysgonomonas sp. 216]
MEYRFHYFIRRILSFIEGFRTNKWFHFGPHITMSYASSVQDEYIKDADIVLVTWWSTAAEVGLLSPEKGKKINLIQGFENWIGHEDLLFKSYNMPNTTNVVVASYLKDIVDQHTENETIVISNAIDDKQFYLSNPIESRKQTSICMQYSTQEIKGSRYGIEALKQVKNSFPELTVDLFGVCPEPEDLPDWMTYYRAPKNLNELYNRNAIFLSNSLTEGFGLVSVEALSCGCALICTDIAGHREYAFDENTALLVKPEDSKEMAEKICFLIENDRDRINLATRGNKYVKNFSWDESVKKMDNLIKRLLND